MDIRKMAKGWLRTLDVAPLREETSPQKVWHALSRDHTVLSATQEFIYEWNEPYLLLLVKPKLVLSYRARGDGRLS